MGSAASIDEFKVDDNIVKDSKVCSHPMFHCWDGVFVCTDCYYRLNDTEEAKKTNQTRIEEETEFQQTIGDDGFDNLTEKQKIALTGKNSVNRGVTIGFLLYFTQVQLLELVVR